MCCFTKLSFSFSKFTTCVFTVHKGTYIFINKNPVWTNQNSPSKVLYIKKESLSKVLYKKKSPSKVKMGAYSELESINQMVSP